MFAPPRYEIYTKMTKKYLISIYNVANLYLFAHQKQPPYLLHRMFKTYVLTNNIKVNTTKFLSMGLMKLATKNHGAGHLPPRRFIFNWPLLMRCFLMIPHCSFLWFHAILRIMEQHTIYKCYYSYKCWICAKLCEAFIFLMENIHVCAIWRHDLSTNSGDSYGHKLCSTHSGFVILSQQRWMGYSNAAVRGWMGEWVSGCVGELVGPSRFTLWTR